MNDIGHRPVSGRAPEQWAKAYAAFLGLVGLILLILVAKGLYLTLALVLGVVIAVAVLVRRLGNHLR